MWFGILYDCRFGTRKLKAQSNLSVDKSAPLRVGIIGLGRVAWELEQDPLRNKPCTHWGAWRTRSDIRVIAGSDTDAARREAFLAANSGARVYADYREMLAAGGLDMLSVCAYAGTRAGMVTAAAQAGVRGIWCEKAMACSLREAREMEEVLEDTDTRMIVSFMRRWAPVYLHAAELIADGAIGALESINVHFSSNMLHTGTHAFDVLRLWCGEVVAVQAWLDESSAHSRDSGYRFGPAEAITDFGGFALLHFANGMRAPVHAGGKKYFRFEFEVLGSRGILRLGNRQRELWQPAPSDHYSEFKELRQVPFPYYPQANMWQAACDNLVGAVYDGDKPACSVVDGRKALAIALAMHLSHREGHRMVALEEVPQDLRVSSR